MLVTLLLSNCLILFHSRFWFHFTVENTQRNQRVLLNLVNLSKYHNLFRRGMTPLIKSTSRPRWQRMPQEHVFYYRSPAHRRHMVLSFVFCFDKEDERCVSISNQC